MQKTKIISAKDIKPAWHLLDAKDQVLGRLLTNAAELLMGKHKPSFTSNLENGDFVVVINAKEVVVTRNKATGKIYRHHTGFPGGFREIMYKDVMAKDPRKIITKAVAGMLPKNKLRAVRLKRLKVFTDDKHPYQNQFAVETK